MFTVFFVLGRKAVAPASHKTKISSALPSQFNPMELKMSKGDLSEAHQGSAVLQLGGELREPYPPNWPMIDRFFVYILYDRQAISSGSYR